MFRNHHLLSVALVMMYEFSLVFLGSRYICLLDHVERACHLHEQLESQVQEACPLQSVSQEQLPPVHLQDLRHLQFGVQLTQASPQLQADSTLQESHMHGQVPSNTQFWRSLIFTVEC
jgi:hypothetical protein